MAPPNIWYAPLRACGPQPVSLSVFQDGQTYLVGGQICTCVSVSPWVGCVCGCLTVGGMVFRPSLTVEKHRRKLTSKKKTRRATGGRGDHLDSERSAPPILRNNLASSCFHLCCAPAVLSASILSNLFVPSLAAPILSNSFVQSCLGRPNRRM